MIVIVRDDLKIGTGKIGAQTGHAVLGAYKKMVKNKEEETLAGWEKNHQRIQVFKGTEGDDQLKAKRELAVDANLPCYLVKDAGKTQIKRGTLTALSIGPAPFEKLSFLCEDIFIWE